MRRCLQLSRSVLISDRLKHPAGPAPNRTPMGYNQRTITRSLEVVHSQLRISRRSPAAPRGVVRAPRPGWLSYDTSQTRRASGSLVIRSQRGLAPFLPVVSFCSSLAWECSQPPCRLSSHPSGHPCFTPSEPALGLPISTVEFTFFFGSWHSCPCCVLWPCSRVRVFQDPWWWPGKLSVKCSPDLVSAPASESCGGQPLSVAFIPAQGPLAHPPPSQHFPAWVPCCLRENAGPWTGVQQTPFPS